MGVVGSTSVPNKLEASWWVMTLRQEDAGGTEVRSEGVRRNGVAQGSWKEVKPVRRVRTQSMHPWG